VLGVADLLACAGRVHDARQATGGGVLVVPRGPVRLVALNEQPVAVVEERRPPSEWGHERGDATGVVALQARVVAVAVRRADHVTVGVVLELDGHAVGIDDPADEALLHVLACDAILRVGDPRRAALVAVEDVARHGVADSDLDQPVGIVVRERQHDTRRQHAAHREPAVVVLLDRDRAVALGHRRRIAPLVVARRELLLVAVDHRRQPTLGVVHERVRRMVLVVVHRDGHAAGQVEQPRAAPERRQLLRHAALVVVGVDELDDTVGIDHRHHAPSLVELVMARARGTRCLDEVA